MTVEEFIESLIQKDFWTVDLKACIKEFVKLKCQEQRELCANTAKIQYDKDIRHPSHWFESIDKDSILNAPEPKS